MLQLAGLGVSYQRAGNLAATVEQESVINLVAVYMWKAFQGKGNTLPISGKETAIMDDKKSTTVDLPKTLCESIADLVAKQLREILKAHN